MIEHESDLWPERRWALHEVVEGGKWAATVHWFTGPTARDAWVTEDPWTRVAVGKRHPAVKALRQTWRAAALANLNARKDPTS